MLKLILQRLLQMALIMLVVSLVLFAVFDSPKFKKQLAVSELGGFPFAVGTSRVWKVDADRTEPATCSTFAQIPNKGCEVYATGLTSLVDLAFGPGGVLYAVQLADAGVFAAETGGPLDGSVQVIPAGGGAPTASIGGLVTPGGVAVDRNHLYITNFSIFPGAGQVVRATVP